MQLTDDEKNLLIEALDVATDDAEHYGEYGGDPDHIPQYRTLKEKLETMLKEPTV